MERQSAPAQRVRRIDGGYGFPDELVCPAVCTDIAAFALRQREGGSYRHDASPRLSLLLIRRGIEPCMGMWALPGGFLRADESLQDCAARELAEETGLDMVTMIPIDVFSRIDRDPRGRVISHAYGAVISRELPLPHGGTDARDARWFDIALDRTAPDEYRLTLTEGDIRLGARLFLRESHFGRVGFDVMESSGLAFDHGAIIAAALSTLRQIAAYPEAMLDLLPEPFTLAQLQRVQETITLKPMDAANFRRKIAPWVEETEAYTTGAGHRPARLYRRKTAKEDDV